MEVLSDKSFRSYDYVSRYQNFPNYYHSLDNRYIGATTAQIQDNIGYSIHVVKAGDTFDSIALDYYNSPTLFWVICDFNKVQDPYKKLKVGTRVKVPVLSSISFSKD